VTPADDLLGRAARALREQSDAEAYDRPDTVEAWRGMREWHDVSRDLRRAARRRRLALIVGLQAVLAVGGVAAWAGVSGRLPALFSRGAPAADTKVPRPRAAVPRHRPRHTLPAPPAAPASPAPPAESPPSAEVATSAGSGTGPVAGASRAVSRSRSLGHPPATEPPAAEAFAPAATIGGGHDPSDSLYRDAHTEHFVRRDYAAALAKWDRYLAAGAGALALEARYNRAIALVRLQRRDAAIAALRPFAAGEHGDYRREEAQRLLHMLGAPPGP
jgi:hypothetical protein